MNDNLQIRDVLFIYVSIILICWILGLKHQLNDSHIEKLEIMKIAIENDRLNKEYISILEESRDSLAEDYNIKNSELEEYQHLDQFIKDLARHWSTR
jgi:CHAT domain-containing protein